MKKLVVLSLVTFVVVCGRADWWYEASADGKSDKIVSTGGWTIPCTRDTKTGAIMTGKSTAGSETDVDLRNVTGLPDGAKITTLGYQTFRSKVAITSVLLPDTITTFANEVFTGCSSLTNVWPFLPPSVTTLGRMVFNACLKLTGDLEIPNVASAGDYAFGGDNASYGTAIKSAKLGSGLQTIPGGLFGGCSSMTSVVFGAGSQVTSIGAKAFINCSSLTEISPFLPSGVTSIGNQAFNGCTSLALPLSLPSIVKLDDSYAFGGGSYPYAAHPTSIVLGTNVVTVGKYAFNGCGTAEVTFLGDFTPTTVGGSAFGFTATNMNFRARPPETTVLNTLVTATKDGGTFHCSKNQGWREVEGVTKPTDADKAAHPGCFGVYAQVSNHKVYLIHAPSPFDPVGMQVILR